MTARTHGVRFIDPDNPPPGLDLSRLPEGVDVNELIASELVSDGELVTLTDGEGGMGSGSIPQTNSLRETVAVVQEVVDAHCFDPGNPEP